MNNKEKNSELCVFEPRITARNVPIYCWIQYGHNFGYLSSDVEWDEPIKAKLVWKRATYRGYDVGRS